MKSSPGFRYLVGASLMAAVFVAMSSSTAQALPITYIVVFSGPAEAPPNASPGTGSATVVFDTTAHTMAIDASFSGLTGTTTASHIHAATTAAYTGTAGVATQTPTFTGFPLGVTSGTYTHTFDMTLAASYNATFLNSLINGGNALTAEASLAQAAADGKAYFNIHTSAFPGGEIRGFLQPVPEPGSSIVLLGIGVAGLVARRQRRR